MKWSHPLINIMKMSPFSLLDDEKQSGLRNELNLCEIYKTRLLRGRYRDKIPDRSVSVLAL